jgi:sialate O-acetylesterase
MQLSTCYRFLLSLTIACFFMIPATMADVRLPSLVSSNMVLQRNKPLHIWGWADEGEKITVRFRDKSYQTVAKKGQWELFLPMQVAGGPYTMTITGKNTITLDNILIGDVWVASGQSNMEMPLKGWGKVLNYEQEIKAADYPEIRFFQAKHVTSTAPQDDIKAWDGNWQPCSPQTVPEFSSVGYFFAREIYTHEHIPVGIIHSSWGGTVAEAWVSGESLKKMPAFADTVKALQSLATPQSPQNPNKTMLLYNAMIHPLLPYAIKGAIWYQGESNADHAEQAIQYRELFPLLIKDWRAHWKMGDFPFFFVQLANYRDKQPAPGNSNWALLRDAQLHTLELPNTGMATAVDIGDAKDIHPKNKQEVGRRLSLIARAKVYGEKIPYSGPVYTGMQKSGNKATVSFKYAEGLHLKGSGNLSGFEVAGADGQYHTAHAEIKGTKVEVWSDDVKAPTAVRYGWADNPDINLYNEAGLPASPFTSK